MAACLLYVALAPAAAAAQSATTGAIAGAVADNTGAVLPGVTVEARSAALIEQVRTAVTDDQGQYKVVELRPGTYTVTFQLPGFRTLVREGIELTTGFTATVDAELSVGAVEETVTVTAAAPVVDVQNSRQQTVLTRDVLDSVPTNKTLQGYAAMTLGAVLRFSFSHDVGGNVGENLGGFGVHGSKADDQKYTMDGMQFAANYGAAQFRNVMVNQMMVQEVTMETKGISPASETGGVQVNVVPKEGGNMFSGSLALSGTNGNLQSDNLTEDIRSRRFGMGKPSVRKIWDYGGALGGPFVQDKLWFYTGHRFWGTQNYAFGNYFNKNQGNYIGDPNSGVTAYEPDLDRQANSDIYNQDHTIRLTWQVNEKDKVNILNSTQKNCNCFFQVDLTPVTPEAATNNYYYPISLTQVTWTRPASTRLLYEGGFTYLYNNYHPRKHPSVQEHDIALREVTTGRMYNYWINGNNIDHSDVGNKNNQINGRFSVSYVTGSHAFRTGFTLLYGDVKFRRNINDAALTYSLFRGNPTSLTQWVNPFDADLRLAPVLGIYAQDQWTLDRLTLNLGIRFDQFHGIGPAVSSRPGRFSAARAFAEKKNIPNWKDFNPRLGAAFDVFGDGRTALKTSFGRHVEQAAIWAVSRNLPANQIGLRRDRTWIDANGNFIPDCDLMTNAANGECGRGNMPTLGMPITIQREGNDVLEGFGARPYNWQFTAAIDHELTTGLALHAGYYRTWYGNFRLTDNLAVTPADYDEFCYTAPVDERLGAASGRELCGLYDIKPDKLGLVNNLVSQASNFGDVSEVYDGVEFSVNARFGAGGLLQGGVSAGRTVTDNCVVVDSPQAARPGFCRSVLDYSEQAQIKLSGVYPLPFGLMVSGALQNLPGIPISARQFVPNAAIRDSLGRDLSTGPGSGVTVDLLEPNTMFDPRFTQLDLRISKLLGLGQARVKFDFDIYNVFNEIAVFANVGTYGPVWQFPALMMGGRLVRIGGQVDF